MLSAGGVCVEFLWRLVRCCRRSHRQSFQSRLCPARWALTMFPYSACLIAFDLSLWIGARMSLGA